MPTDWNEVYREQEEACRKAREEAIEECAKIADAFHVPPYTIADCARTIAAAIRCLGQSTKHT